MLETKRTKVDEMTEEVESKQEELRVKTMELAEKKKKQAHTSMPNLSAYPISQLDLTVSSPCPNAFSVPRRKKREEIREPELWTSILVLTK